MFYKFMAKNKKILIKILFLIAVSFTLKYVTHRGFIANELLGTYQIYMGGIFLEESASMLQIILFLMISALFIYLIPYEIIREIKENEIYIRYRFEKNTKFLFFISIKNIFYCLFYQFINVIIVILITFQFNPMQIIGGEFIKLLITSTIQLLIILFISEFFLYHLKLEIGMVFSLLLIVAPVIISGVILDNFPSNIELCKFIPLNHGNYNYYYPSVYTLYDIPVTYSALPDYKYIFSLISQVIELIISISGLMYAINRKDLIGGNYEN